MATGASVAVGDACVGFCGIWASHDLQNKLEG